MRETSKTSDKGSACKTYQGLLKLNNQKTTQFKNGQRSGKLPQIYLWLIHKIYLGSYIKKLHIKNEIIMMH